MRKNLVSKLMAVTLSVTLPLSAASTVNAAEISANAIPNTLALQPNYDGYAELSAEEEQKLANDLETLFTEYIQLNDADLFEVNEANLVADGYQEKVKDLHLLADSLNEMSDKEQQAARGVGNEPVLVPLGAGEFALCVVVNGLGIPAAGASPGLVAAIKEGIRAWNWGLTAKTVARILGPSVAKALGGPVGIGVALGWAAYTCRDKL